jgi:hypothetical protein
MTRNIVRACHVSLLIALASCDRQQQPKVDIASAPLQSDALRASREPADTALGQVIGYRSGTDSSVAVLLASFAQSLVPDTLLDARAANGTRVDLFGSNGFVGSAVITNAGMASNEEGCYSLPRGQISPVQTGWEVALPSGRATGLPLVSLSDLHGSDSSEITESLSVLAQKAPGAQDTAWHGLKFTVENGVRLVLPGVTVVAATMTRMLPGPEHFADNIFLVGERAAASPDHIDDKPELVLAYSHRTAAFGRDDWAESGLSFEDEPGVDAAVITKANGRPTFILETRGNEVNGYAALARVAPGHWKVIWNGGSEGGC